MPKAKTIYSCRECGYQSGRWLGRCPSCASYNTMDEEGEVFIEPSRGSAARSSKKTEALSLEDISDAAENRMTTGIGELDRVLSGGIVEGSLVLIGGDPGIGKSTLLLQICNAIGEADKTILYVSGEESATQIKLRADRLGITTKKLLIASQTSVDNIKQLISQTKPDLLIIDSIQTMYREDIASAPGSVSQVRECTSVFMRIAKEEGISVIIVGHVTKDGAIAGPRVLEHMVDVVLYFEGERRELYRLLRSVKNRYGSTNEIGVFEMNDKGLREITNPSEYMLAGRPIGVTGSVVTCSIEGTRPLLAEVQALVTYTNFGTPRRMASGMDYNRVVMLIAVLEKRAGLQLGSYDSYVNIAGGLKILEPALDASALLAVASSYRNKPVDPYTMVFGEVGLTGEMRAVAMAEKRLNEAVKLGFKACVLPQENTKGLKIPAGIRVFGAGNIAELLQVALD